MTATTRRITAQRPPPHAQAERMLATETHVAVRYAMRGGCAYYHIHEIADATLPCATLHAAVVAKVYGFQAARRALLAI